MLNIILFLKVFDLIERYMIIFLSNLRDLDETMKIKEEGVMEGIQEHSLNQSQSGGDSGDQQIIVK